MSDEKVCTSCSGDGICRYCDGIGWRYVVFNGRSNRQPCSACNGVGACAPCRGRRVVEQGYDDVYLV